MRYYEDNIGASVVGTPGLGTITLGSALTSYGLLSSAANGLMVDVYLKDGTAWGIESGCLYTHVGTTIARGTPVKSSTGSALSLTSAAEVYVVEPASRIQLSEYIRAGYGFGARGLTTGTGLTSGAFATIVNWNTPDWNIGSVFVPSTGVFTAPVAGRWSFTLGAQFQLVGAGGLDIGVRTILRLQKNGVDIIEFERSYAGAAGALPVIGGTRTLLLAAGDTVTPRAMYSGSTGSVEVANSAVTTIFECAFKGE